MSPLLLALASVTALFAVLLAAKAAIGRRFCVICASVGTTWLGLLIALRAGAFADRTTVALLMGQSVVGIYYLAEKRLSERYHVFRLPFLLTLTAAAAAALGMPLGLGTPFLLAALWACFAFVFALRHLPSARALADRVVACCRDW